MGTKRNSRGGSILYLMVHFPFFWWWKIGITGVGAISRAKWIDKAVFGFPIPILVLWLPGAYHLEQWLHRRLSPMSVDFYRGDGHTEWFWFPAAALTTPPMLGIWWIYLAGLDAIFETNLVDIYMAILTFVWHWLLWLLLLFIHFLTSQQ